MSATNEWRKLTRKDLTNFHSDMRDLVLEAMARGGVGRISNKGHAIVRAPGGNATMSVAPKAARNRNLQNCRSDFNKLFGHLEPVSEKEPTKKAAPAAVPTSPKPVTAQFECPAEGCEEKFSIEGALHSHINKKHFRCPEHNCERVFTRKQGVSLHVRRAHGDFNPGKKKEPAVKAAAVAKSDDTKLVEQIRKILGSPDSERVKELETELAASQARVQELEDKLSTLRAALQ